MLVVPPPFFFLLHSLFDTSASANPKNEPSSVEPMWKIEDNTWMIWGRQDKYPTLKNAKNIL